MSVDINPYDLELKVKNYLITNQIRLCDPPYTNEGSLGSEFNELIKSLSQLFTVNEKEVSVVVNGLRDKSLLNIRNQENLKAHNIYSIKVHIPKIKKNFNVEFKNFQVETGGSLCQKISDVSNINKNEIRVIYCGKVIEDSKLLINQGIKNNSKVLVLIINQSTQSDQQMTSNLTKSRSMADYLSKRVVDGQFKNDSMSFDITNQSGEVLSLSNEQKSLLTYGLTMHQQASNYLMEGQYQLALLHCLDAEDALERSDYSDQVDNTALIQLDIVWCYYSLQNMDDLVDAKTRLEKCELCMQKSYGAHNERIQQIRSRQTFEGVPESVHLFRLYLMKCIVAYYYNNNSECRLFLEKAKDIYESVVVPSNLIHEVMLMGFSRKEALSGLQVSRNVEQAIEFILRRRDDKAKLAADAKERDKRRAIAARLGYTNNKSRVNLDMLERLINETHMSGSLCLAAIRRSNNDIDVARELVFSEESRLSRDVEIARLSGQVYDGDLSYMAVLREKEAVAQLEPLVNVDKSIIRRCLRQSGGNTDEALNILLNTEIALSQYYGSSSDSDASNGGVDNNAVDQTKYDIENDIYHNIGKGSAHNIEERYKDNELINEIEVFNKFATLVNYELIA